jgi:hypothetical protein
MRIVLATERLVLPGGSETYLLTVAEHLTRLGADVTVMAPHQGMAADWARERGTAIVESLDDLPPEVDATLAFGSVVATDLAAKYPGALRLFVAHNLDEAHMPPPIEGIVAATIVPNERLAKVARGHLGTGEVIRMTQPIDTRRFSSRGDPQAVPRRVLLLGNNHELPRQRATQLKEAWAHADLEWLSVGQPEPTMEIVATIGEADIVVGYGRSILEAMSCSRPAYVHDSSGSDGWVTEANYEQLEADGFSGAVLRAAPDVARLRADLALYDPHMGRVNQDITRQHHDARIHAGELMTLMRDKLKVVAPPDPDTLQTVRVMAANWIRAEQAADRHRIDALTSAARFQEFRQTSRYKLATVILTPLDKLKRLLRR